MAVSLIFFAIFLFFAVMDSCIMEILKRCWTKKDLTKTTRLSSLKKDN